MKQPSIIKKIPVPFLQQKQIKTIMIIEILEQTEEKKRKIIAYGLMILAGGLAYIGTHGYIADVSSGSPAIALPMLSALYASGLIFKSLK